MKLLRVGEKNKEKPAILDKDGNLRDISKYINDLDPTNLNFETFEKIKKLIYHRFQKFQKILDLVHV